MPNEASDIEYLKVNEGSYYVVEPNFVQIGFGEDNFFFDFATAEVTNENKKNNNIKLSSAVRVVVPADAVLGLSDVISKSYSEFRLKYPEEETKCDSKEDV